MIPTPPADHGASIDRRSFVKTLSAAGLGAALAPSLVTAQSAPQRRRYAIVGVGSRSAMYQGAIEGDYKAHAELVAICDRNPGRMEVSRRRSTRSNATPAPAYLPADFEKMVTETKPEIVIVTTMDSTHDEYIIRAMNAGCDVITEKPMTTTP